MSIFLDYKVELPPKEQYTCTAWSCTETILAVAFKSQQILFYQEEVRALVFAHRILKLTIS